MLRCARSQKHAHAQAAVWTFSATHVGGVPTIVYPGIAGVNSSNGDCGKRTGGVGCFTHAVAVPVNLSDPWLTEWTKPSYNPTVEVRGVPRGRVGLI